MKSISWIILLFSILLPFQPVCANEEYLTVEERNRRAQEDMMRLMEAMKAENDAKKNGTFVYEEMDYSIYTNIWDFKNIFGNLPSDPGPEYFKSRGRIWQQREQSRHFEYARQVDFDFVVVPIQDFSDKYDLTSRLYPAELIAKKIAEVTGKKVLSPELFHRASDTLQPVIQEYKIVDPGNPGEATFVCLYLKVAKDWRFRGDKKLFHELAVVVTDSGGTIEKFKIFRIGEVSDTETLEVMIKERADEIVSFITQKQVQASTPISSGEKAEEKWKAEGAISELMNRLRTPLDHAAYLQLLALLTPQDFEEERQHLFERSLLALQAASQDNWIHRLLKARGLHYLHRRPQAMTLLKGVQKAELQALRAYLNGNFSKLKEYYPSISSPLLATMSFLEFDELSLEYGKKRPQLPAQLVGEGWKQLVERAVGVRQAWYYQDDEEILTAMKGILPSIHTMEQEAQGELLPFTNQQERDLPTLLKELLLSNIGESALDPAALPYSDTLVSTDIHNLFMHILADSIVRDLQRIVYLQGLYERGIDFAQKRSPYFEGLPGFSYYNGLALYKMALQSSRHQRKYLLQEAYAKTCDVMETTPSHHKYHALSKDLRKFIRYKGLSSKENNQQCHILYKSSFPSDQKGYRYEVANINSLITDHENKRIEDAQFDLLMSERFDGHPEKIQWKAKTLWQANQREEAITYLQKLIKEDFQAWGIYSLLGDYLMEDGQVKAAGRAYFSFPDFFSIPSGRRVGTGNLSYQAGANILRTSHYQEALPFFNFAGSIGTGSGSEMRSRFELACLEGDFKKAAEEALHEWERYESKPAFGRYALMLQLMGYGGEVEDDVTALLQEKGAKGQKYINSLWGAYLLEKNINGADLLSILEQIQGIVASNGSHDMKNNGHRAAFEVAFQDRMLTPDILDSLKKLAPELAFRPRDESQFSRIALGLPEEGEPEKTAANKKVESIFEPSREYADVYEGCIFLQRQEYHKAFETFLEYDRYAPVSKALLQGNREGDRILPHAVMAFIASEEFSIEKLQQMISAREKNKKSDLTTAIDYLLTAILHAAKGSMDKALHSLEIAPLTFVRSGSDLDWYQLVCAAEWLFDYTGETAFQNLALEWVDRLQVIYPYLSWPYAFEALHGAEEPARIEASAYAWYLNRNSLWLSQVPESIRREGEAAWPTIQQSLARGQEELEGKPEETSI